MTTLSCRPVKQTSQSSSSTEVKTPTIITATYLCRFPPTSSCSATAGRCHGHKQLLQSLGNSKQSQGVNLIVQGKGECRPSTGARSVSLNLSHYRQETRRKTTKTSNKLTNTDEQARQPEDIDRVLHCT